MDYAIAYPSLFPHINEFYVDIFDRCLSDVHNPLILELSPKESPLTAIPTPQKTSSHNEQQKDNPNGNNVKANWESKLANIFTNSFNPFCMEKIAHNLTSLQKQSETITQKEINQVSSQINKIYKITGEQVGVIKTIRTNKKTNPNNMIKSGKKA